MEAYENLMKEIDTRILAIEKHLVSGTKLEGRFEESLKAERLQLKKERGTLLKQYCSLRTAPQGDWDLPETIETQECEDCAEDLVEPLSFKNDSPITNIFTKKFHSPRDNSPAVTRYRNKHKNLTTGRTQVYMDHVFETSSNEKNPFFEHLSTQTDVETEETTSSQRWHIRQRSYEISPSRHQLINAIGGVSLRNISYVLGAFDKKAANNKQ